MEKDSDIKFGDSRLPKKFWDRVLEEPFRGCWQWIGHINRHGYAQFCVDNKHRNAHRHSYINLVGFPDKPHLDHLCRNRSCVNPAHLEPETARENLMRGDTISAKNAKKTHCPKGHPYDAENTHIGTRGERYCRTCFKDRWKASNLKRKLTREQTLKLDKGIT